MLSTGSIRSVHSKRSLTAMIDRFKRDRDAAAARGGLEAVAEDSERPASPPALRPSPIEPPRIAVVTDKRDALEAKKQLVSQLPFQHRNPAV